MRNQAFAVLMILGAACATARPVQAGIIYSHDDGTGETAIGLTGPGDLIWLNRFVVVPPFSRIDSISVAFGSAGFGPPNGTAVTVALWKDPNNDGNPADAVLLATATGVIANSGTDTFNLFDIPDTDVGSGSFFVGALVRNLAASQFPARTDLNTPGTDTWLVAAGSGAANLSNLSGALQVTSFGTVLVRANAEAVPEPATLAVFGGIALAGAFGYRRRKATATA